MTESKRLFVYKFLFPLLAQFNKSHTNTIKCDNVFYNLILTYYQCYLGTIYYFTQYVYYILLYSPTFIYLIHCRAYLAITHHQTIKRNKVEGMNLIMQINILLHI